MAQSAVGLEKAEDYVKAHGRVARDIMTKTVVSSREEASLAEIAQLLEKHRVKRVPILRDGKLVGIVSRADLLHGMIGLQSAPAATSGDRVIRESIGSELRRAGVRSEYINIVVAAGVVDLWGMVHDEVEITASRLAAEQVPGVKQVNNHLNVIPANIQGRMGGE
ncbi:MAG: CBS domain-containing protein [Burkholderiaceae bacterium]